MLKYVIYLMDYFSQFPGLKRYHFEANNTANYTKHLDMLIQEFSLKYILDYEINLLQVLKER